MVKKYIAILIATLFGIGFIPVAPGTVASAAVSALWYLISPHSCAGGLLISAAIFIPAVFSSGTADVHWGTKDNGRIVIDEVVGVLIPLSFACTPLRIVVAFVLFRIFDIAKPFPIRNVEKYVPGGMGVVIDDVVAGIYSAVALVILIKLRVI